MYKVIKFLTISAMMLSIANAQNIYATFTIEAQKSANLAFTSTGIVQSVDVEVAERVHKGQKLSQLDNSDLASAVNIAKADLENTKIKLKFAKRAYDRERKVKKLISEQQHDQVIQAYESAMSMIDIKEATLAYKQSLLEKSILYAPFDGVIYDKQIEVGDAVSGAMIRTVLKIHSIDDVKLIVEFDQKYWKQVKLGQKFLYRVDGDKTKYEGKITKIYPYADSNNRKIKAEVSTKGFMVGLFGDGYIITDSSER
ncbi:Membrane fusion protein of RND family multidrug efflux pump [hydrothermal vent metagenome]|uniref:Membrane fusion protein of RND family multidrug efflux pump n=1 Tax=hydrothermal vent metagenome TaxID=652676 RepID=A0A1W1B8E0_9ZZZZ